jgi:hypothetical protein
VRSRGTNSLIKIGITKPNPGQIHYKEMELDTTTQAKKTAKAAAYKPRLDPEKEDLLQSLSHQFLRREETHWRLLWEKLSLLQSIYKGENAFKLCRKCLCFYSCNKKADHKDITVDSLFKKIDFEKDCTDDLLDLLKKHGRSIRNFRGEELIGVPGFNLRCGDGYYFAPDQAPAQPDLQESSFHLLFIPSKTGSDGDLLNKRPAPPCANSAVKEKGRKETAKPPANSGPKPAWVPSGKAPGKTSDDQTPKKSTKKSINKE